PQDQEKTTFACPYGTFAYRRMPFGLCNAPAKNRITDRSISRPVGVAEDVYVKLCSFHFSADFVVVDFDADARVPLILGRSFLKTERVIIDVFEGELTLRVGKEAITFNLDQTSRYSANYSDMTAKRIEVIDMECEEYSQEVLRFSDTISSGNPTPYYDPIVATTSLTLTPLISTLRGDILLLKAFLNDDPSPPPSQGNYLPEVREELKICEAKSGKSSVDEPPEIELKDLPPYFEYAFLEGDENVTDHHCKRFDPWVSPVHCAPNKGGFTVVENKDNELIPTRLMLKRLARNQYYCFLDGFSGYFQIPIDPKDQEKTTFTCLYGTFACLRMPFGICNAPGTFQRCMMAIFHGMIEKIMEVFMDNFFVFGNSFQSYLSHLERMLKRCEDTNLCLNWEKSHFMVKEGIVLGHKISKQGIEVDKAKVDVITKLPYPTTVKGIRSFLGHAGFYRRFIKDFSKIARPMTRLLEKDNPFIFYQECVEGFQTLKRKLTEAPILIAFDWDMPFELMCDASDFAIGAVLEAESNYTTTEKEMLAVVYAFEKFRSYLIMNKSIVYTDHSVLKYLFAKKIQRRDCSDGFYFFRNSPSKRCVSGQEAVEILKACIIGLQETSGQVEVSNRGLKCIQERAKGENHASWSNKLDDALWAFWTAYKTPIGCTPYRKVQINKLNKLNDQAYENSLIYKEKTKRLHDSKIKNLVFNIGDRVLLFNSRLKIFSGKLKSRWSGPFTISQVYPYGTVEFLQPDGPNFKVNGHRVNHYFKKDVPKLVVPDLQTFPRDH
nr:DNA-directed DNA polymerase [Tanacetum cinerariifolium]